MDSSKVSRYQIMKKTLQLNSTHGNNSSRASLSIRLCSKRDSTCFKEQPVSKETKANGTTCTEHGPCLSQLLSLFIWTSQLFTNLLGTSGDLCVCSDVTGSDFLHQLVCSIYGLQKGPLTFGLGLARQFLETNERFFNAEVAVRMSRFMYVYSNVMCATVLCTWSKRVALR